MKKKNIGYIALLGLLINILINHAAAQEGGAPPQTSAQTPAIQTYPSQTGEAPPGGAAPTSSPPPGAMPTEPTPLAATEEKTVDINAPLLTKSQCFRYRGLSSNSVTLKSLRKIDCDLLCKIYVEDPQRAVDHVSLLLLVQRVLQGANVRYMCPQDRVDLAYATILGELRKYGRSREAREYMGLGCGECSDRLAFPTIGGLCQVLEGVKAAILIELYHYRLIFPPTFLFPS